MPVATRVGVVDHVQLWPGVPATHYRLAPPMVERDEHGAALAEYADVLVWVQPQLGEHQAAKAVMIPAMADGMPSGRYARPISELAQGPWNPSCEGLFYINGYQVAPS